MAYEPSPYRGFPMSARARPAARRRKDADAGTFGGTNDRELARDGHVWAPATAKGARPSCRRCGQAMFQVEGRPCSGRLTHL